MSANIIGKVVNFIKNSKVNTGELAPPDMPTFAFIGFSIAFLLCGFLYTTLGGLINAGSGEIFSPNSLLAGLTSIGISIAIAGIGALYWWLIPRKYGIILPAWNGFGFLIAALAFASGVLISAELVVTLSNI